MTLSWLQIVRLGLVQLCIGAVVVLTTSTLNRLMVVELALPAMLSGALVALHSFVQITRPSWGFLSDAQGNRTRFIIGGMAVLALGAALASWLVALGVAGHGVGLAGSVLAYVLIGMGAGASGTSLLALLASGCAPSRRAAAATITWLMMIFGIAVTSGVIGALLDPYSPARLMAIVGVVTLGAVLLTAAAIWGIERRVIPARLPDETPLRKGLAEVWAEQRTRVFTLFIFLSMTAFFLQELILEPYAGLVFAYSPGASTSLSGAQHGGMFVGMLAVGIAVSGLKIGSLRAWVTGGCLGSALMLAVIAALGQMQIGLLTPAVALLGVFSGMFAIASIGAMMQLAGQGRAGREGTRMGVWGASQAIAQGLGGFAGAALVDALRLAGSNANAFGIVFALEALLFVAAGLMAWRIIDGGRLRASTRLVPGE
ncbi:BCD family MFS transporter [Rhodobacter calidifons]|uniref:BCD family MFS transporter n=1 Tax=Rhodobacter calidifons TaxID=2715277 RepID=A0ABX0G6X1_9RHOB|nr:BCD family MFS transporter [Rhodobacter calidifons]NHB76974.1 BCD family MFS transporter [Rhodobacter calidifons]